MTGEVVTVIRAGQSVVEDRYGEPLPGADVERDEPRAWFAPTSTAEAVTSGEDRVITAAAVYWRRSVDVTAADRVRVRGVVYTVEGDPAVWVRGGRVVGTVAQLRHVEG